MWVPKSQAGIGFKVLSEFKLALLANRVAVLMSDSHSLLFRVNKARYSLTSKFMEANMNGASSYAWRIIFEATNGAQYRYEMGDGRKVKIWSDK